MRIETKKVELNKAPGVIFEFLSDFRNFENLMPGDKIEKWTATPDTCSFVINGMANIGMKIQETFPPSEIRIVSFGKNPFDFKLTVYIDPAGSERSIAYLLFEADVNPFLQMMAEKPLSNFFNMLSSKLEEIYG